MNGRPLFSSRLKRERCGRAGTLTLPHGTVETPAFMPVGTQGTVRALSPADLQAIGAGLVLANTYHLHVRPGEAVVAKLGGLHRFMAWDRPLLTDSGGFQVFSLEGFRQVTEDGVQFQSHVDGSRRTITPESAVEIHGSWPDIAMASIMSCQRRRRGRPTRRMEATVRWIGRALTKSTTTAA